MNEPQSEYRIQVSISVVKSNNVGKLFQSSPADSSNNKSFAIKYSQQRHLYHYLYELERLDQQKPITERRKERKIIRKQTDKQIFATHNGNCNQNANWLCFVFLLCATIYSLFDIFFRSSKTLGSFLIWSQLCGNQRRVERPMSAH